MRHEYRATVRWVRDGAAFIDNKYSRAHIWRFDGGVEVLASSSPLSVRLPYSREDAVDPEEAFVAALSSCHMLFFLTFAAKAGFVVDSYEDRACGIMEKNSQGKLFVSKVTLDPRIAFSGEKRPSPDEIAELHHRSHEECFIANSVKSEVVLAGVPVHA
ncbi:MAG: OsmC family protein [Microvirga sp.]